MGKIKGMKEYIPSPLSRIASVTLGHNLTSYFNKQLIGRDDRERRLIKDNIADHLRDSARPGNKADLAINGPFNVTIDLEGEGFTVNFANQTGENKKAIIPLKQVTGFIRGQWDNIRPYIRDKEQSYEMAILQQHAITNQHNRAAGIVLEQLHEQGISANINFAKDVFSILAMGLPEKENPSIDMLLSVSGRKK